MLDELIVVGNSDEGLDIALAERGEASDGENGQAAGIRHSGVVDVGDACGVGRVGGLERVREEGAVAREADARFANEARTENVVPANGGAVGVELFGGAFDGLTVADQAVRQNGEREGFRIDQGEALRGVAAEDVVARGELMVEAEAVLVAVGDALGTPEVIAADAGEVRERVLHFDEPLGDAGQATGGDGVVREALALVGGGVISERVVNGTVELAEVAGAHKGGGDAAKESLPLTNFDAFVEAEAERSVADERSAKGAPYWLSRNGGFG